MQYEVEFLITVTRKFADPSRGIKSFSDTSSKTVEAADEAQALDRAFDEAVQELAGITGVTPDIDKGGWKFSVTYENGSGTVYSDFHVKKN